MSFPIFDKVGGTEAALAILAKRLGKVPSKFVQDKWRSKGKLPFKVGMSLMDECHLRGIGWFHPTDFEWHDDLTPSSDGESS